LESFFSSTGQTSLVGDCCVGDWNVRMTSSLPPFVIFFCLIFENALRFITLAFLEIRSIRLVGWSAEFYIVQIGQTMKLGKMLSAADGMMHHRRSCISNP
jgi:hypothetical protein